MIMDVPATDKHGYVNIDAHREPQATHNPVGRATCSPCAGSVLPPAWGALPHADDVDPQQHGIEHGQKNVG